MFLQAQQGMQQAVQRANPAAQQMMMQRAMQQQAAAQGGLGMPGAPGAQPPAGPPQEADMSVEDMSDVTAVAGIDMVTEQNALLAGACRRVISSSCVAIYRYEPSCCRLDHALAKPRATGRSLCQNGRNDSLAHYAS